MGLQLFSMRFLIGAKFFVLDAGNGISFLRMTRGLLFAPNAEESILLQLILSPKLMLRQC
jgi:hypothetical protein